jgi:hypothetical protein
MRVPCVLCFVALIALAPTPSRAADKGRPADLPARYVKIEVKGKLTASGNGYAVRAADAFFSNVEVLVRLERGEDKNRSLDDLLKSLEGKMVVVTGFLDCRRLTGEKSEIHIHISQENQVKAVEEK